MKVIVLNRGDLIDRSVLIDNPYSDVWLNGQESAEAIVPEVIKPMGRAER